jgi:hypothetical protein
MVVVVVVVVLLLRGWLVITQGSSPGVSCDVFPPSTPGSSLTLFTPTDLPAVDDARDDNTRLVLGFRFTTTAPTDILAIRFFKARSESSGDYSVSIFDAHTHVRLVSATASTSSCRGGQWVEVPLPSAFTTVPNTQYIVAVDNVLYYPKTEGFFTRPRTYGDIIVLQGVFGVVPGQIAEYGSTSNYYIDRTSWLASCWARRPLPLLTHPLTHSLTHSV